MENIRENAIYESQIQQLRAEISKLEEIVQKSYTEEELDTAMVMLWLSSEPHKKLHNLVPEKLRIVSYLKSSRKR